MIAGDVTVHGEGALEPTEVERVVTGVLQAEHRTASLSITFLDAGAMQQLNAVHKGHDTPTDVLSFALPQPDGSLAGDIYVCPSVAATEAAERGIPLRQELIRLVVHGVLHTLGYDHPEGDARAESEMWQLQERYVEALS